MSNPKTVASGTGFGIPERPIESFDDDKLEREPFVRRLASALIDGKTGKSRGVVIGITGPWGSGKSSILNLVRACLKANHPDAVIVSFNPWLISGRNDLITEFINELLATIKLKPATVQKLGSVTDKIVKYGEQLAPKVSLVPSAAPFVQSGLSVLKAAREGDVSLSRLRKELINELLRCFVKLKCRPVFAFPSPWLTSLPQQCGPD